MRKLYKPLENYRNPLENDRKPLECPIPNIFREINTKFKKKWKVLEYCVIGKSRKPFLLF